MMPPQHANGHELGFAVETVEGGDVLLVAESADQRATWLWALREVVGARALRNAMAVEANVDALVAAGCRSAEEMAALGAKTEEAAALPAGAAKMVDFAAGLHSFSTQMAETMSVATLGLLVAVGCTRESHVRALSADAVAALPGAAAQEVAAWKRVQVTLAPLPALG